MNKDWPTPTELIAWWEHEPVKNFEAFWRKYPGFFRRAHIKGTPEWDHYNAVILLWKLGRGRLEL